MADKNGIWAFILKILIQIFNFILSKISKKKDGGTNEGGKIEYKHDEQENKDMKEKVNDLIKDKLNKKEIK